MAPLTVFARVPHAPAYDGSSVVPRRSQQGLWDGSFCRVPTHRDLALEAMRALGALTLPVESILFRLQRQAGIGVFKQLSALVK